MIPAACSVRTGDSQEEPRHVQKLCLRRQRPASAALFLKQEWPLLPFHLADLKQGLEINGR